MAAGPLLEAGVWSALAVRVFDITIPLLDTACRAKSDHVIVCLVVVCDPPTPQTRQRANADNVADDVVIATPRTLLFEPVSHST